MMAISFAIGNCCVVAFISVLRINLINLADVYNDAAKIVVVNRDNIANGKRRNPRKFRYASNE